MSRIPADCERPTFDKNKPFGQVFPPENGAHFAQDGFHFDVDGNLVEDMLTDADVKRLETLALEKKANAAAAAARAAFLKDNGLDPNDPNLTTKLIEVSAAAQQQQDAGGPVDLVAWAKGEAQYKWFKVMAAAKEQHSFVATDARALVAFLVDQKLVAEADVKVRAA